MRTLLPLALLLTGCPTPESKDSEPDTTEACEITIDATVPMDGATEAYYRAPIEFHLSGADPDAVVFADFTGEQSSRDEGAVIVFTPDEPLEPNTPYEVGLDYCHGAPTIGFTTSTLGVPVPEPAVLEGLTWAYDLRDARFYQAGYLGDLLQTFAERMGLISVLAVHAESLEARLAMANATEPPEQDFCARTSDIPNVDFSGNPYFRFGPTDYAFDAYLGTIELPEMSVEGTIADDGSVLGGLVISAVIDVRSVADAVQMDVDELCDILVVYSNPCEACPGDGEPYCVSTAADGLPAERVTLDVEPIEEAYEDPRCEEEPE